MILSFDLRWVSKNNETMVRIAHVTRKKKRRKKRRKRKKMATLSALQQTRPTHSSQGPYLLRFVVKFYAPNRRLMSTRLDSLPMMIPSMLFLPCFFSCSLLAIADKFRREWCIPIPSTLHANGSKLVERCDERGVKQEKRKKINGSRLSSSCG